MRNFDFSPLYRTTIGFDHLSKLLDSVHRADSNSATYPPYNIELVAQDKYRITMAVAGFSEEELDIHSEHQTLTIKSRKPEQAEEHHYLHQGIAARNFERRFQLAEHIEVKGARLSNGLLHIELEREIPEAMKPKQIPIGNGSATLIDAEDRDAA